MAAEESVKNNSGRRSEMNKKRHNKADVDPYKQKKRPSLGVPCFKLYEDLFSKHRHLMKKKATI